MPFRPFLALFLTALLATAARSAQPDILIADFEGETYGPWKATGEAFGPGPAAGTLPGQMAVSGFEGKRLVNSFYKGDGTTGRLTSPPLKIERRYINFLIGGGMHPSKTCINLLVNGKVVRTATGPNDRPGGTEALDWESWDVGELIGKQATIEIVDEATGGWGHINVDQIVQSDRKRSAAEPAVRELRVEKKWLHLPVKNGGRPCWMQLIVDGKLQREFEIELAQGKPDYWTYTDIGSWQGKTLRIEAGRLPAGSEDLAAIAQADDLPGTETMYREALRPQFHFTPRRGWTNDPNGLVFYQGEYHLFFQHNPYGTKWGNMTWGHAVSPDLLHWKELPDAIHPDPLGTIFSGSAVVDGQNTAGFLPASAAGEPSEKPIVCIYTAAGGTNRQSRGVPFTQALAYSLDRGRTWTKYEKNPVLGHIAGENRDPKVFWHRPSGQWVMALYLDGPHYALFGSPDLKQWRRLCDIPDVQGTECPDLFELPVDGDKQNARWVFWSANGNYLIGQFDGKTFTKESGPHVARYGANDYAAQTYSDIPAQDGRRIQISWMNGGSYPDMPFNQQMTIPRVLTLRKTSDGIRLFMEPIGEVETLRGRDLVSQDLAVEGEKALDVPAGCLDIVAEIDPCTAKSAGMTLFGQKIEFSPSEKKLTALGKTAPLDLGGRPLRLRILIDRTSIEVFADAGRVQLATCYLPPEKPARPVILHAAGQAKFSIKVWEIKSVWR